MPTALTREIDCILCEEPFTPVIEPEDGENGYAITCSSPKCSNSIFITSSDPVRTSFRGVYGIRGEPLALALEESLADCPCGSRFSHDAGKRCPECIQKIQFERRSRGTGSVAHHLLWSREAIAKHEQKLIGHVLSRTENNESLNDLVEKYESEEISSEEYLDQLDLLQNREAVLLSILKTWAISLGPENAFRVAEDLDLVYNPPVAPAVDPLKVAAREAMKAAER